MKTLCIDARMMDHSGIGTYIRNILIRLPKSYQISLIVSPASITRYRFLEAFKLIPTTIPIYSVQEQIALPYLIPDCDLFWTPHYNIPLGPIRAKKRIVTIHDVNHLAFNDHLNFLQKIYARFMLQQAAKRSDHIFTVSSFSRDEIVKYTDTSSEKITPIYNGVDRSHFYERNDRELLNKVRQKYGLPESYILFVSNLAVHKNVRGLLLAWKQLLSEIHGWKLVIVGKKMKDTKWQNVLNSQLEKEVIFLGSVDYDDLPIIYENAYATVLPSFYEGFGLTPLESISCGCPVVVSKIASLLEIFEDSAQYIDPHNPQDIARGLKSILLDGNLHRKLKIAGLERSKQFDWDIATLQHKEVIEKFL